LILEALGSAYGAAAARRRRWYERHPDARKRLARPVVSVGNLALGGTGKTPIIEYLARLLQESGHRPAVLTRGYGRRLAHDGVTVVSDGERVLADVDRAGDEPLMLARSLPGVPVLVGANRYLSGRLAEQRFGTTVHLLDDGFQHLQLERTLDLLLVSEDDLSDRPVPAGRLREPLAEAAVAHAALVTAGYPAAAERIGRQLGIDRAFRVVRTIGPPRRIVGGEPVVVPGGSRVFVVVGVARPDRFVADLVGAGWDIVGMLTFRDHHPYTRRDVAHIASAARAAGASIVLTTAKDAERLAVCDLADLPIAAVPLDAAVDPDEDFLRWILARLSEPCDT